MCCAVKYLLRLLPLPPANVVQFFPDLGRLDVRLGRREGANELDVAHTVRQVVVRLDRRPRRTVRLLPIPLYLPDKSAVLVVPLPVRLPETAAEVQMRRPRLTRH